jgi:hypothetical protein
MMKSLIATLIFTLIVASDFATAQRQANRRLKAASDTDDPERIAEGT